MAIPFAVTAAMHMLGLNDAQQAEVANNTLPALDDLMHWINTNPATVKALIADVQKAAPGLGVIADAAAGKGMNMSEMLHAIYKPPEKK